MWFRTHQLYTESQETGPFLKVHNFRIIGVYSTQIDLFENDVIFSGMEENAGLDIDLLDNDGPDISERVFKTCSTVNEETQEYCADREDWRRYVFQYVFNTG